MESRHFMNPQYGKHLSEGEHGDHKPAGDVEQESGQHKKPHISIHSHAKGHTVHVMHHDGSHTKHEHAHGDVEGMKAHIDKHLSGGKESGADDAFDTDSLLDETAETHR